ncbi:MAG: CPXCG motif-containing cysteine-rich protein [Myxococcaceae bacterium]
MDLLTEVRGQVCPWCGEWVEVGVEQAGASRERFVEDCQVCCRPWLVEVLRGEEGLDVHLRREDDPAG